MICGLTAMTTIFGGRTDVELLALLLEPDDVDITRPDLIRPVELGREQTLHHRCRHVAGADEAYRTRLGLGFRLLYRAHDASRA